MTAINARNIEFRIVSPVEPYNVHGHWRAPVEGSIGTAVLASVWGVGLDLIL